MLLRCSALRAEFYQLLTVASFCECHSVRQFQVELPTRNLQIVFQSYRQCGSASCFCREVLRIHYVLITGGVGHFFRRYGECCLQTVGPVCLKRHVAHLHFFQHDGVVARFQVLVNVELYGSHLTFVSFKYSIGGRGAQHTHISIGPHGIFEDIMILRCGALRAEFYQLPPVASFCECHSVGQFHVELPARNFQVVFQSYRQCGSASRFCREILRIHDVRVLRQIRSLSPGSRTKTECYNCNKRPDAHVTLIFFFRSLYRFPVSVPSWFRYASPVFLPHHRCRRILRRHQCRQCRWHRPR